MKRAVENDDFLGDLINGLSKQYVIYNFTSTLAENPPSMNFQLLSITKVFVFLLCSDTFLLCTNGAFQKKKKKLKIDLNSERLEVKKLTD